jgi:hypothetical protein
MSRIGKALALGFVLLAAPATVLAASSTSPLPGAWRRMPAAPVAIQQSPTGVWTGKQLIVYGRRQLTKKDAHGNPYIFKTFDVAAAYTLATDSWRELTPPPGPDYVPGYKSVWTGKEMLVFGAFHSVAYTPATKTWRELRKPINLGFVAWTGKEAIGWGGGCCGDAQADGSAYDPATGAYRKLSRGPLPPSQGAIGAWTGRELLLFVSGFAPDGKPYPARFARAAAYDPATNTWRRLAPFPATGQMGSAAWDGKELLVAGTGTKAQSAFAYNPTTNRWRRLASLPAPRVGASAVWMGNRLVLWGGQNLGASATLKGGFLYEPHANSWTSIPAAPFRARSGSIVASTGRALIVWGGEIGTPLGTSIPPRYPTDGAVFTPMAKVLQMEGCGG